MDKTFLNNFFYYYFVFTPFHIELIVFIIDSITSNRKIIKILDTIFGILYLVGFCVYIIEIIGINIGLNDVLKKKIYNLFKALISMILAFNLMDFMLPYMLEIDCFRVRDLRLVIDHDMCDDFLILYPVKLAPYIFGLYIGEIIYDFILGNIFDERIISYIYSLILFLFIYKIDTVY